MDKKLLNRNQGCLAHPFLDYIVLKDKEIFLGHAALMKET